MGPQCTVHGQKIITVIHILILMEHIEMSMVRRTIEDMIMVWIECYRVFYHLYHILMLIPENMEMATHLLFFVEDRYHRTSVYAASGLPTDMPAWSRDYEWRDRLNDGYY